MWSTASPGNATVSATLIYYSIDPTDCGRHLAAKFSVYGTLWCGELINLSQRIDQITLACGEEFLLNGPMSICNICEIILMILIGMELR